MKSNSYFLQLARLNCQKGDFREGYKMAEQGRVEALESKSMLTYSECVRLVYQSSFELNELHLIENIHDELLLILQQDHSQDVLARCNLVLGMWYLAKHELIPAETFITSSLESALKINDLETVGRALYTSAIHALYQKNLNNVVGLLEKAEIIISELKLIDVQIGCLIAKSQVYSAEKNYEKAFSLLWCAMEKSRIHGFFYLSANILVLLAKIANDQGDFERMRIYGQLAINGITPQQYPRLNKIIQNILPADFTRPGDEYDFILNQKTNVIKEREKGIVDFRNQHILFELAQKFIKNPGSRYGKEELIQTIWMQNYEPQIHDNLIYVSIKRLRLLLEPEPECPRYILRDRKGYFLPKHISVLIQA